MYIFIFSHQQKFQLMFPDNCIEMTAPILFKFNSILKNKSECKSSQKILTKFDMITGLHYDIVY